VEVYKASYVVPTSIVGTDEQGRTLVTCPSCHEPAPVLEDGTIACPLGEVEAEVLRQTLESLESGDPLP
jgi:hypothetical protein